MLTQNLGYPRIGANRELKKACELYWAGRITEKQLAETGRVERLQNWEIQIAAGIDLIPCNDFSFYDQVQDMTFMLGAIPERFKPLREKLSDLDLYFAMCRGYQANGHDVVAMEMTKWFDTNYHYMVPEFTKDQTFGLNSSKIIQEFTEARAAGVANLKPVLIGPVTYLLSGKEKEGGFYRLDLLDLLLEKYLELLTELESNGCKWVQFDEPCLVTDLTGKEHEALINAYTSIRSNFPDLQLMLVTYFGDPSENLPVISQLPVDCIHIDVTRIGESLNLILNEIPYPIYLSLGLVDGRNIWKNNLRESLDIIMKVLYKIGEQRVIISPSCSLLHSPYDLESEQEENELPGEYKQWMSFARQKLAEVSLLKELSRENPSQKAIEQLTMNEKAHLSRTNNKKIHIQSVKNELAKLNHIEPGRNSRFKERSKQQVGKLGLPLFPATTIGSFPQTAGVRKKRNDLKKGLISETMYDEFIAQEIQQAISFQESIGIDVLVHGEFERNDMVEYFGEQLEGFVFTRNAWVQSYGSRCVKPPIIIGDIARKKPLTLKWTKYAQSLTQKKVKGMLTGPVTLLQWSFVRNDQPRKTTAMQLALAVREEVLDLEKEGIDIIQIDEPGLREGLPLRKADRKEYLNWAVKAFRVCYMGIRDTTQLHTHMCYAEFNDIIDDIAALDADVITIETSRSQMELLKAFAGFNYPNQIGPGVYDIHSPRIPTVQEMEELITKAIQYIPKKNIWINPDCGLKTRSWEEVKPALTNMMKATVNLRERYQS